jgi:ubiquinone/menaquinone biosynthesis C-methylase UbiE
MQNLPSQPDDISNVDVIGAWDQAAEEFASFFGEDDEFWHTHIINPCLMDLVGDATGKTLLDLGCGEGHLARQLADMTRRDIRIIAVDASAKMIQIAKEKSAGYANCLTFQHADAGDLAEIRDDSIDIALCNMALMDIKNCRQAIQEVSRTLRRRGIFVFSILHPCFFTPGSEWLRAESGDVTGWKVDNYHLALAWKSVVKSRMNNQTYYFHRTLEDYCSMLCECGFAIVSIREPIPSKKVLEIRPTLARELKRGGFLVAKSVLLEEGVGSRTAEQGSAPDRK